MQEMTQPICYHASIGETKQLIDSRDNKKYWVTKLADNNCWMTQNLAFDASHTGASSTTPNGWGSDNIASKYWNPGTYVYSTPTTIKNCGASGIASLASCTSKGWVNVSGWTASSDPNYSQVANTANKIYDAHYLSGNYYSWMAATANSGKDLTTDGDNASDSICPAGWKLPSSGTGGQIASLFVAYGTLSGLNAGTQDIRLAPLYFVYGGYIGNGTLLSAGSIGNYWSSMAYFSDYAYALNFDSDKVTPSSGGISRFYGLSVRCVAR